MNGSRDEKLFCSVCRSRLKNPYEPFNGSPSDFVQMFMAPRQLFPDSIFSATVRLTFADIYLKFPHNY